MTISKLLVASAFAVVSSAAFAAPLIFTGDDLTPGGVVGPNSAAARATFLSNLAGGVGTENFEGIALGTAAPFGVTFPGTIGNITASITNGGAVSSGTPAGAFATSGTQFLFTATGVLDFTITFSTAIAAFGFYGTDLSDSGGDFQIELTDSNAVTTLYTITTEVPARASGSVTFWGFVDPTNTYTSLRFINTSTQESFGFDDFTIGDLEQVRVPEPAAFGLMGLGLAAISFARRRRRA